MSFPLSFDLRERVVHAVEEGSSRRSAARRGALGSARPAPSVGKRASCSRGGRRSQHVEAQSHIND